MVVAGMEIDHKELVVELMEAAQTGKESGTMLELRLTLIGPRNGHGTAGTVPAPIFALLLQPYSHQERFSRAP